MYQWKYSFPLKISKAKISNKVEDTKRNLEVRKVRDTRMVTILRSTRFLAVHRISVSYLAASMPTLRPTLAVGQSLVGGLCCGCPDPVR